MHDFISLLEELNEESFEPKSREILLHDFNNRLFQVFLLFENGVLAGCAVVVDTYSISKVSKILYLGELYIRAPFRRKGLGKILFEHVISYAKENKYLRLEWRTAKDNASAQELYNSYATDTDWVYYVMKF